MSGRLPKVLRGRAAERRRVEEFVAAIRATAPRPATPPAATTLPLPAVRKVDTPLGPVWALDEASRARLRPQRMDDATVALPLDLVALMIRP